MTDSLCILSCVGDAKDFLKQNGPALAQWTLVSTHGSVNDFLAARGISSSDLSSFVSDDELVSFFAYAGSCVDRVLRRLDEELAGVISDILGVRDMNYFYPLYAYLGKYECLNMLKLKRALDRICGERTLERIQVYRSAGTSYFGHDVLPDLVASFSGLPVEVRQARPPQCKRLRDVTGRVMREVRRALCDPSDRMARARDFVSHRLVQKIRPGRPLVLLLEPFYDLFFLKGSLSNYTTIVWPYQSLPRIEGLPSQLDSTAGMRIVGAMSALDSKELEGCIDRNLQAFLNIVRHDFLRNLEQNVAAVSYMDSLHKHNPLSLAAWGCSPAWGFKCLLVEYLLRAGVPVLGMQHGGAYGVQHCYSVHFDSDFNRCTDYFTYGFTEEDLKRMYPDRPLTCRAIPAGSYKLRARRGAPSSARKKRVIDILFPITMSLSFFEEGFRIRASQLYQYQKELITFLDSLVHLSVCIKPTPDCDANTCAFSEQFKRLRCARVLKGMTLIKCLNRFQVRAVVIDYPSTPLFEVVGEDIEIFLLADPVLRFSRDAMTLLKKRVHYFEDVDSLKSAVKDYLKGNLPSLRDCDFYRKYVAQPDTRRTILETIDGMMRREPAVGQVHDRHKSEATASPR